MCISKSIFCLPQLYFGYIDSYFIKGQEPLVLNLSSADHDRLIQHYLYLHVSHSIELPVRVSSDVKFSSSPEECLDFTSVWDHSAIVWLGPPVAVCDFSLCSAQQGYFLSFPFLNIFIQIQLL